MVQILIHTDSATEGGAAFNTHFSGVMETTLGRFETRVTRVEAHVTDENGAKHSNGDKRCAMEAHINGHQPVAVTHHADTVDLAIRGATEKLERLLDSTFGRLRDHR